jgi:hypothetical protein
MVNPEKSISVATPVNVLTAQEICCGVKRDMTYYKELKEYKHFNSWNRGFNATAHMHHTHLALDTDYSPTNAIDVALFKKMQTFMYAVLQEHLKWIKGSNWSVSLKPLVTHKVFIKN